MHKTAKYVIVLILNKLCMQQGVICVNNIDTLSFIYFFE